MKHPPMPAPPRRRHGAVAVTVDPGAGHVTFTLTVSNLSSGAVAGHIHQSPVGVAGPIVVPVVLSGGAG